MGHDLGPATVTCAWHRVSRQFHALVTESGFRVPVQLCLFINKDDRNQRLMANGVMPRVQTPWCSRRLKPVVRLSTAVLPPSAIVCHWQHIASLENLASPVLGISPSALGDSASSVGKAPAHSLAIEHVHRRRVPPTGRCVDKWEPGCSVGRQPASVKPSLKGLCRGLSSERLCPSNGHLFGSLLYRSNCSSNCPKKDSHPK